MADLFVSYKAEDRERVRPLVDALAADGFSVWWDAHISAGGAWRDEIGRELGQARCVLVIWSRRSVGPDGSFVRDEASRALKRGTYLPVLIDAVAPPLGFGELQGLPLTGWHGDRADPLYETVRDAARAVIVGAPRPAFRATPVRGGIDRRWLLGGGAAPTARDGMRAGRAGGQHSPSRTLAVDCLPRLDPTASLAGLGIPARLWADAAEGSATIARFTKPRDLEPSLMSTTPSAPIRASTRICGGWAIQVESRWRSVPWAARLRPFSFAPDPLDCRKTRGRLRVRPGAAALSQPSNARASRPQTVNSARGEGGTPLV